MTLWSGISYFSQISFFPNLSQTGTPRNPASPAACLQTWSTADVQEKVGRWSKETLMLLQNVSNPPLDCSSPGGKSFVFSSYRWILFHEYIASFSKPVQPVPVCHGKEMQNCSVTHHGAALGDRADSLSAHWVSTSVWDMSVLQQEVSLQIHRNMYLY